MAKFFRSWQALALVMGMLIAITGGVLSLPALVASGVVLSLIGEVTETPSAPAWRLINQAQFISTLRSLGRGLPIIAVSGVEPVFAILAVLGLVLAHSVAALAASQLELDYARPVRARGIGNTGGAPRSWIALFAAGEAVALLTVLGDSTILAVAGLIGGAGLILTGLFPALRFILVARRAYVSGKKKPSLAVVQDYVVNAKPLWLLHASGGADTAYQVEVWLSTLEQMQDPGFILLRDEALFDSLAPTTIPVICLPGAVDVMSLDLSAIKVALFPAHVGNSIHLLRLPSIGSAFIGHGDSDKSGSSNPFARAYDQVWVAGEAGERRYEQAGLTFSDGAFVRVGRPQASMITPHIPDSPTLLYAPTWEGWNKAQEYSSLVQLGPSLIERALEAGLRVIYRPHPLTGHRNPRYRKAHEDILNLLSAQPITTVNPDLVLPELSHERSARAREQMIFDASARFFEELNPQSHVVVEAHASQLDLATCFNASTAMITDVSSVITDYLASGKPYAVFNHLNDEDVLRETFPSTSAGSVISSAQDFEAFLAILLGTAPDTLAEHRRVLSHEMLGDDTTADSFERAIRALASIAQRRA